MQTVDDINKQLIDLFGIDTESSNPIWRVVYSDDQYEHRHGTYDDYTPNGLFIRSVTEVRYVPKYKQWIQHKYILERFVIVPDVNVPELPMLKKSYEPIWTFEDKNGNALPPRLDACQFIINTVYAAQYGTHNLKKYHDPEWCQEASLEEKKKRTDALVEELFGEQSSLEGTTVTGESIIVPRNYEKVN
jgi:hypothetical protein